MLYFIGLGLYGLEDITIKGLSVIHSSDHIFLETYTSILTGTTIHEMESFYNKKIIPCSREDIENNPEPILSLAENNNVAFLVPGDSMISTTHSDLRIRAEKRGIVTKIIHNASIATAVCGLTGLQNYRFGRSCSLPFPYKDWRPVSPADVIIENQLSSLHTLVYLDIQPSRYMTINEAVIELEKIFCARKVVIKLYIGIARAGSDTSHVYSGKPSRVINHDFGGPLHILVVPGSLHPVEEEYLALFAGP